VNSREARGKGRYSLAAEPSAVVCFNDLAAIGVISRLRERVVAAPGMSVTGI
jgi:DNA-binding LacI/PurR family transcriptional regulator